MMSSFTDSLRARALAPAALDARARTAIGMVAFVLLTALSAQIAVRLPWTPVPVTLQTLFVVLAGALLGARAGATSIGLYVVIGALGAPIFANGGAGLPWLLGPSGGYLLAAPAAAWVAGSISGRERSAVRLFAGLVVGVATLYAGGVAQLAGLTGQGLGTAVRLGVLPFVAGDVVKVLLAFFAVTTLRGRPRTAA